MGDLPNSVLFCCDHNAVRSPMAEGMMKKFYGHRAYVQSAGVKGEMEIYGFSVAVCAELGVELQRHRVRSFEEMQQWGDDLTSFDLIVALSPAAQRQALEFNRYHHIEVEYWPIMDPTGFKRPMVAVVALVPVGWRSRGGVVWGGSGACGSGYAFDWSATSPDGAMSAAVFPSMQWSFSNFPGVAVPVKGTSNHGGVDDSESVRDEIGPALRDEARRAAAVVGVRLAGVDVITNDPAVGLGESGGVVLEVNTTPGLQWHYRVRNGGVKVAEPILERLLQEARVDAHV